MCTGNSQKRENPKMVKHNEIQKTFWTKEGEVGNLQADERQQTFGKQILAGPARNNGTQR